MNTTMARTWQAACVIIAMISLQSVASSNEPQSPSLEGIRSAWNNRKRDVGHFEYQFKVIESEFVPLKHAPSDDPFDTERDRLRGKVPERAVELVQQMTYKSAGEKWNVTIAGDLLNHSTFKSQPFRAEHVSDGITNWLKHETTKSCYGIMATRGATSFGGECPGGYDAMAVSLWCNPNDYFAQNVADLTTLRVVARDLSGIESECIELSMERILPRLKQKTVGNVTMQVERELPHLVRQVDCYLGKGLRSTTSLAYVDDKSGKRIISEWSHVTYDERGIEQRSSLARLTSFKSDCEFDPEIFDLTYPVGTIVTEFTDNRRQRRIEWRQGADGKLEKVSGSADKLPK